MLGKARLAVRRSLDAGPDPYAHLQMDLATRLGGAIWLIAVFYALITLPLAPPEGVGPWVGSVLIMGGATGMGLWLVKKPTPARPNALLLICYVGVLIAATFRWAAGAGAPFPQFLLLATIYSTAVHPARRAFPVLGASTLAAFSPMLYESAGGTFYANTVANVVLYWSLGLIVLIWTTRVRVMRREAAEARAEAEQHARIDALTGLGNRRALEEQMALRAAEARRRAAPLSALVGDLDAFKAVNDEFGHQAGDEILRAVARALIASVRVPDPCFRFGGDEFVALLPDAGIEEAQAIADRVTTAVMLAARRPDGQPVRISVGVAELGDGETADDMLGRADAALMAVKDERRTRRARAS